MDQGLITQINGILLTPLKIIQGTGGAVFHGMKQSDPGYLGFGEAYFSSVERNSIKGWKRHREMTLNLVVPVGEIEFAAFDARSESISFGLLGKVTLSPKNYQRLTVPPNIWLAFRGKSSGLNMLLNLASIPHRPEEAENIMPGEDGMPFFPPSSSELELEEGVFSI